MSGPASNTTFTFGSVWSLEENRLRLWGEAGHDPGRTTLDVTVAAGDGVDRALVDVDAGDADAGAGEGTGQRSPGRCLR